MDPLNFGRMSKLEVAIERTVLLLFLNFYQPFFYSHCTRRFGNMYLDHAHSSQWPGFSLTPALWDLNVLSKATGLCFEDDETVFALKVLDAGLLSVHLPAVNYKFLG